jgi:hypothetical protein
MFEYRRLGELLLAENMITREQLVEALQAQIMTGQRLGEILVFMGALDEDAMAKVLATQYGLDQVDVRKLTPQPEALALVEAWFAVTHLLLPVELTEDALKCVIADPLDILSTDAISQRTGKSLRLALATPTALHHAIVKAYGLQSKELPDATGAMKRLVAVSGSRKPRLQKDRETLLEALSLIEGGLAEPNTSKRSRKAA